MSEYCYQCLECGEFREYCICRDGFKDPMGRYKEMTIKELMMEELK